MPTSDVKKFFDKETEERDIMAVISAERASRNDGVDPKILAQCAEPDPTPSNAMGRALFKAFGVKEE